MRSILTLSMTLIMFPGCIFSDYDQRPSDTGSPADADTDTDSDSDTDSGHTGVIDTGDSAVDSDSDTGSVDTGDSAGELPGGDSAADADADGYDTTDDCDDHNNTIRPGATEACDGIDNDCDGTIDDGCPVEDTGSVDTGTSCTAAPYCKGDIVYWCDSSSGEELSYDCTLGGQICGTSAGFAACEWAPETDVDGDGYTVAAGDCDDSSASVHPGATETCNSIDDDCDGSVDESVTSIWYGDSDSDGYGDSTSTKSACSAPSGYVANSTDCDDSDASVNPGATEVSNSIDDDCDGSVDEGFGCYLSLKWSDSSTSYYYRFSYESGDSAAEAEDGDAWSQYFVNETAKATSLTVTLDESDTHPVVSGYFVRFSFEVDSDTSTSNGASGWNANHSTLLGTHSAYWVQTDGTSTAMTVSLYATGSGGEGLVGPMPTCK